MTTQVFSRRRYSEAVKALKSALKSPTLPWVQKLRAIELLLCIYGVPIPEPGRRERRAIKDMVADRGVEKMIAEQVRTTVEERARQEAEAAEEADRERTSNLMLEYLKGKTSC